VAGFQMSPEASNPAEECWGDLDDVRIYNRALSPGEIQQLYFATGGQ